MENRWLNQTSVHLALKNAPPKLLPKTKSYVLS
jgi:hypothetical protein